MEVLGYKFENVETEKFITDFISKFHIIETDSRIRELVIRYRKTKKISLPDAIILATAESYEADLFTYNLEDFKNMNTKVKIIQLPLS